MELGQSHSYTEQPLWWLNPPPALYRLASILHAAILFIQHFNTFFFLFFCESRHHLAQREVWAYTLLILQDQMTPLLFNSRHRPRDPAAFIGRFPENRAATRSWPIKDIVDPRGNNIHDLKKRKKKTAPLARDVSTCRRPVRGSKNNKIRAMRERSVTELRL